MTLADLTALVRTDLDDYATAKYERQVPAVGTINSSNKTFTSKNYPISGTDGAPTLSVWKDGTLQTITTHYTVTVATGTIVFTAGASAPTTSVILTYGWQYFTDAQVQGFIEYGLRECGGLTTTPDAAVGLIPAVQAFANHKGFQALYAKYLAMYKAGAGDKSIDKDDTARRLKEQAKASLEYARQSREDYNKGQGAQFRPGNTSYATTQTPYTPPR